MNAKITFTKRTIKGKTGDFQVIETNLYNTPVRASRALCDKLKERKPIMNGTGAEYELPVENLRLSAQVKNGFTNLYITWTEPKAAEHTEDGFPF